ncbi:Sensory box histidine kinase/response regulator [hydrothermal vent metagenome]|uniref:Sensory box histidine kinase/response regulator n=1 Tax=hydrothermal vent metagenome TaxID=652676 RepID=A0A3B1AN91_9ZZZZ
MGNSLRVLVVEDSEDDALLLDRELRRSGYSPRSLRVQTAERLQAALQEHTWDVVVTDHNLPGFSSEAALAIVKDSGLDLPVIIVSGSIGEDIAVAAMKMGAHDYIMKDNLMRLVPAIERELREAELRRSHRLAEATIHHLAFHDHLTGLVNRHEFDRRLKEALRSAKESEHAHVLLYLDLDQFKVINDTCGHQAGDQLLRQLAVVLREKVRSNDTLARLGGDEFGLLLESCPLEQAHQIAEGIREAVANFRFVWKDKTFSVGVSIGMTPITSDAQGVDEVLSAADVACYTAKDLGRNRVHVYLDDDSELLRRHNEMRWVSRIKQALEDERFVLYLQPMQALDADACLRAHSEFLLRMVGDDGKIILPGAFIPAAERYGIMTMLDRWVVKSVIEYLAGLYQRTPDTTELGTFFVNLSGASLNDAAFFSYISEQLKINRLPPELLCFEVTETAAISNLHLAVDFIHGIRSLGCQFALDDFGSGLSSFSYLKAMPVDYLKIDGGFVRDITSDPMNYAIVQAVNEIGHVAGLRTIAEFVENDAVFSTLQDIGVDLAQGYGIARPMAVLPVALL